MKNVLRITALSIILFTSACTCTKPVKEEIGVQTAVGTGVLKDWDKLTDDNKKQAYWKSVRGWHNMNYALNDVPVPADFQKDPWAPAAPPATPVGK